MKLVVFENIDESLKYKKKWEKEKKVIFQKLFYFKKRKGFGLGLNFLNLPEREIPNFKDLKDVNFFWVDGQNDLEKILSKRKKIIYSFLDFEKPKKELKNIFNFSKKDVVFKIFFFVFYP